MSENLAESQEELVDRRTLISSNTSLDTESCNLLHPGPAEKPGTSQAKNTNSELQDATESEGSVRSSHQAFKFFYFGFNCMFNSFLQVLLLKRRKKLAIS